jgi:hypothetical protein
MCISVRCSTCRVTRQGAKREEIVIGTEIWNLFSADNAVNSLAKDIVSSPKCALLSRNSRNCRCPGRIFYRLPPKMQFSTSKQAFFIETTTQETFVGRSTYWQVARCSAFCTQSRTVSMRMRGGDLADKFQWEQFLPPPLRALSQAR